MEPDGTRMTVMMSNFGITSAVTIPGKPVAASSKTGSLSYSPEEQLMLL